MLEGKEICLLVLREQLRVGHGALPELSFLSGYCRNLSEPVMTYKLHKELVLAASKSHCCPAMVLSPALPNQCTSKSLDRALQPDTGVSGCFPL